MGKVKRVRQKFHASTTKNSTEKSDNKKTEVKSLLPLLPTSNNPFSGLNISFASLKKSLNDDTKSVASFKSVKSEMGSNRISKKDKIKLRHEILLHKIDTVTQMKKKNKQRKKRKNNVIMGDTNALHDALPSLDSLLKSRDFKIKVKQEPKKRAIVKTSKRQKNVVQGINSIKKILSNKQYKDLTLSDICNQVKQRVQSGQV